MSLYDTITNDLQFIEADLGNQTFTWNEEDFICLPSSNPKQRTLSDGGFEITYDLLLSVRSNQFSSGSTPSAQQLIQFQNTTFRINKVEPDATKALIKLYCMYPSRGV